jgi:hypothetical protein
MRGIVYVIALFLKLTEKLQRNELIKLSVSIFVMPVRNSEWSLFSYEQVVMIELISLTIN